jgi:hypothetical protein
LNSKLKTTEAGLIYIKPAVIITLKKANTLEGVKVLGKPVIINAQHICFLSHNTDGNVTYFMTNGFEISLNIFYDDAEEILNAAKANIVKSVE